MHDVLRRLCARAGRYQGNGVDQNDAPFSAHLELTPIVGRRGVKLRYIAVESGGSTVREEHALIALDADSSLTLWPVSSESSGVLPHTLRREIDEDDGKHTVVFGHGSTVDQNIYRAEIAIDLFPGGDVGYRHAWGHMGSAFRPRTGARLKPIKKMATIPG